MTVGSIRPRYVKTAARKLLRLYPNEFTKDFETNKRLVEQYTDVKSKKVRNRIAGYLVTLIKREIEEEARRAAEPEEIIDMEM